MLGHTLFTPEPSPVVAAAIGGGSVVVASKILIRPGVQPIITTPGGLSRLAMSHLQATPALGPALCAPQRLNSANDLVAHLPCSGVAAHIWRAYLALCQHLCHRTIDQAGGRLLVEEVEHHAGRQNRRQRIGDLLAGDVRRRTMHWFEHRGMLARGGKIR